MLGCKAVLRKGSIANNKNDGENIAITDNGDNYISDDVDDDNDDEDYG